MNGKPTLAVVLLSGGLDSTVTLALAKKRGYDHIVAISFNYNQRHKTELSAATDVAAHFGVTRWEEYLVFPKLDSALTDPAILPHENRPIESMSKSIPNTWVPGRNAALLTYACQFVYNIGTNHNTTTADVYIGVNILDYSGYPDCRSKFIAKFEHMINAAMEGAFIFNIKTPLINSTKVEIIQKGLELNAPLGLTVSCYYGTRCGKCDSCILRAEGFKTLGIPDPAEKWQVEWSL